MKRKTILLLLFLLSVIFLYADDNMVLIIGDDYYMGSDNNILNMTHQVEISSFYISKYEVTIQEWKEFCLNTQKPFRDYHLNRMAGYREDSELNDHWPVFCVTWIEALEYCNWLSEKKGYTKVYNIVVYNTHPEVIWNIDANGYRLPTEAEWEYAARGKKEAEYSGSNEIDEVAWFRINSG